MSSGGDRNDFPFLFFLLIHYRHNFMGCEWDGRAGSGRGRTDRVEWMDGRMEGLKRNDVRTCFFLSSLLMCVGAF